MSKLQIPKCPTKFLPYLEAFVLPPSKGMSPLQNCHARQWLTRTCQAAPHSLYSQLEANEPIPSAICLLVHCLLLKRALRGAAQNVTLHTEVIGIIGIKVPDLYPNR